MHRDYFLDPCACIEHGREEAVNRSGDMNDAIHPIQVGDYVSLYATGEGQTSPPGQDGRLAANRLPLPAPQLPVTFSLDGQPAPVVYAGAAPGQVAGLMQVVIQVPAGVRVGGYVPVTLQVGSASTIAGAVWIAVTDKPAAH